MSSTSSDDPELRGLLRSLPVFEDLPVAAAPDPAGDPVTIFATWLREAIDAGVREPHTMVLSTVAPDGSPQACTLIVKSLARDGRWRFAGNAGSAKGRALATHPAAALTFYWPSLGRQARVRGPVAELDEPARVADFLARSAGARAEALVGRQGQPLDDPAAARAEYEAALRSLTDQPSTVAPGWRLWELIADEIELLQATPSRDHVRVRYARTPAGWQGQRIHA